MHHNIIHVFMHVNVVYSQFLVCQELGIFYLNGLEQSSHGFNNILPWLRL